jgi:hypothetical protein
VEKMKVNICGIPHEIIFCEDNFDEAIHFGQIDYKTATIKINKDMKPEIQEETIIHEMLHGILVHLGYDEKSDDEQFVNAVSNAIYQGFDIKIGG